MASNKKSVSSRQRNLEPDKKRAGSKTKENKSVYEIAREQTKKELEILRQVIFDSVLKNGK